MQGPLECSYAHQKIQHQLRCLVDRGRTAMRLSGCSPMLLAPQLRHCHQAESHLRRSSCANQRTSQRVSLTQVSRQQHADDDLGESTNGPTTPTLQGVAGPRSLLCRSSTRFECAQNHLSQFLRQSLFCLNLEVEKFQCSSARNSHRLFEQHVAICVHSMMGQRVACCAQQCRAYCG